MGMFNKYKFDAKEEAARRQENLRIFHEMNDIPAKPFVETDFAELEMKAIAQTPIVKIEKDMGFCSATCPNCGKVKILDKEIKTMSAVCNKCYCVFLLEE